MSFLTHNPVPFGAVVKHKNSGAHFLVVGFLDAGHSAVVCERSDCQARIYHRDSLILVKQPRKWAARAR